MIVRHPSAASCCSLISTFAHLRLSSNRSTFTSLLRPCSRTLSTTASRQGWLAPKHMEKTKSQVGRPRLQRGGSIRGTTVVWGEWGLRMKDHDRRVSAKQLKLGEDTIRQKLRGTHYKLFTRVSANIGVYTKGNEVRMGKGKGKFDYWAARVPVSRIIFELKGNIHEQVAKDAFRLAGNKMPGMYEFVRKGEPAVVGLTPLRNGITLESLKEARRPVESPKDPQVEGVIPSLLTEVQPSSISTSTAVS